MLQFSAVSPFLHVASALTTRTPPFVEFTHALTWFTSPCALAIVAMTPMQTTPATLSVSNAHLFIRAPLPGSAGLCCYRNKPDEMPYANHGPFGPVFALAGPTSNGSLSSFDVVSLLIVRSGPAGQLPNRARGGDCRRAGAGSGAALGFGCYLTVRPAPS